MENSEVIVVQGTLVQGHRVASGLSENSPFPRGTIDMQASIFMTREPGLNLSKFYMGTLNVSIAPRVWEMLAPWKFIEQVKWCEPLDPEDFYFMHCNVCYKNHKFQGYVYYPSPKTKKIHFQDKSTLEILAPKIEEIAYNDRVILELNLKEIRIIEP